MDAQDIRSLQEAYSQVYELEEGMTMQDFKKQRSRQKQSEKRAADKIAPNRRKDIHTDRLSPERAARHRANVDPDFEGNDERNYPGGKLRPNKVRKAKALGELGEQNDIYDIILSHLLDEGYAETPEAAEAIMVNMGEEWRENIMEVSDRKVKAVRNAREKQWNNQFGKNRVQDPTDDMVNKVDKLIDQRNKRTGSNVKKTTMGQLSDKYRKG